MRSSFALACCLLAISALPAGAADIALPESTPDFEAVLAKRFPAGTATLEVVKVLNMQDFACGTPAKDVAFDGGRAAGGTFTLCEIREIYGFMLVKRWRVAIVADAKDRVEKVLGVYGIFARN